jgi:hypothetical protein
MGRIMGWSLIVTAAAIIAGGLLALPVWDHYHYSQAPVDNPPIVSASLAGSSGPVTAESPLPSAEAAAPPGPEAKTLVIPAPTPRSDRASRRPAPSMASAAQPRPATAPPAADPVQSRVQTRASNPAVRSSVPVETGAPAQKSTTAASNPTGFLGWLMGGGVPAVPATPSPAPRSTSSNPNPTPQPDPSRPAASPTPTPDPDETASLRLSVVPDRPAPSRGETFTVEVVLTGARDITSVPFHLQFDPGILQYLGARTGPALNGRSLQPIFLASVNPARPGDLAVGLSLVRTSGTFSGSGTILLLDFLALAAGRSDLLFDRASVRGPTSAPLPAEIVGAAAEVR